jgi:hypothetical protein
MTRTTAILFAGLLCNATVPAFAAWGPVGSVDFSAGGTREMKMGAFNGNAIGLTARDSDVKCDHVVAKFGDGCTREIFRGELPKGQSVRVDLPSGMVDDLDFNCHPTKCGRGAVDIAADTIDRNSKS